MDLLSTLFILILFTTIYLIVLGVDEGEGWTSHWIRDLKCVNTQNFCSQSSFLNQLNSKCYESLGKSTYRITYNL